jgi:glycosyltransferase involved in cell wall biosynthesis
MLSKMFRKKVVLHLRGGNFRVFYDSANGLMKWIVRTRLRSIERMIVLGSCLKPMFAGLIPDGRISVVPNGIDFNGRGFGPDAAGAGTDMIKRGDIILFLSNFMTAKGVFDVLHSVPIVKRSGADIRYIFAGEWVEDGGERAFMSYVGRERLTSDVEIVGAKIGAEKKRLYGQADIFVFPPAAAEGHPWVIIEAMAAGLPIITTNQGCIAESVIDGDNGFIIPPRDPGAIADKILFLRNHPEVREKMGRRSRELYEANFTEEHFVQRMIDAIRATLKDEGDRA